MKTKTAKIVSGKRQFEIQLSFYDWCWRGTKLPKCLRGLLGHAETLIRKATEEHGWQYIESEEHKGNYFQ